jgi:hypothetical protein
MFVFDNFNFSHEICDEHLILKADAAEYPLKLKQAMILELSMLRSPCTRKCGQKSALIRYRKIATVVFDLFSTIHYARSDLISLICLKNILRLLRILAQLRRASVSTLAIELIRQVASPNSALLRSNGCFKHAVVGSAHLFYAAPEVATTRRDQSPPHAGINALTRPIASEPNILDSHKSKGKRQADQIEDKSLEERLRVFYKQHQPALMDRAAKIAQLYSGREEVLNTNLSSTYGADLTTLTAKHPDPHARTDLRSHLAPARHEPTPPSLLKPSAAVTSDPALRALAGGRRSVDPARGGGREPRGAEVGGVEGALPPWAKPLDLPQFLRLLRRDAFVPDILSVEQARGRTRARTRVHGLDGSQS